MRINILLIAAAAMLCAASPTVVLADTASPPACTILGPNLPGCVTHAIWASAGGDGSECRHEHVVDGQKVCCNDAP